MVGAEKAPLSKICRTYPTMKKLGTITLPKGDAFLEITGEELIGRPFCPPPYPHPE